jgi:hypothetical protein
MGCWDDVAQGKVSQASAQPWCLCWYLLVLVLSFVLRFGGYGLRHADI